QQQSPQPSPPPADEPPAPEPAPLPADSPGLRAKQHTRSSSGTGSVSSDAWSHDDARYESINVEYLRNVLFRFFNDKDRRPQLVPVLSNLLNCKPDEIRQIQLLLQ
ncbi:hypothetical protein IWW51_005529, partial [Coemansia sp. RSA 2702]